MTDLLPATLIFGSVTAGFAWGRISAWLPIPEWLRLVTTPLWTGALAVIVGWLVSVSRLDWKTPRVVDAGALGAASVLRLGLGYALACFVIGSLFGLPASLGWVLGYRQTPVPRPAQRATETTSG